MSGYLTKIQIKDLKAFYRKRLTRVIIPYLLWSFIYTITTKNIDLNIFKKYLYNIITTKGCYTLYYIGVYVQLVMLTPILGKIAKTKFKYVPFVIQPIWIFMFRYVCNRAFAGNVFTSWISYYYLGMLLGNNIIKIKVKYEKWAIFYLISILIQITEGMVWYKAYNNMDMATTQVRISSMISSIIFLILSYFYIIDNSVKIKNNRLYGNLVKIGNLSFGIYLCHPMIIRVINKIDLNSYLVFPINTVIVLILSIICLLIGNRIFGKKVAKYLGLS